MPRVFLAIVVGLGLVLAGGCAAKSRPLTPPDLDLAGGGGNEAREVVWRFFQAAWSGQRAEVEALMSSDLAGSQGRDLHLQASPLSVRGDSTWELILWQTGRYDYRLLGEPTMQVRHNPEASGWAEVDLSFAVEALDRSSGVSRRWDFTEYYRLREVADGFRVEWFDRCGIPWESAGGNEAGWEVKAVVQGPEVRLGPFTDAAPHLGRTWSGDGERLALVGGNFNWWELWVVDRDGSTLTRLLRVDRGPARDVLLWALGWSPGDAGVRFALVGRQPEGPHAGREGLWVAEVSYPGGKVREIAFIESPGAVRAHEPMLTGDGTALLLELAPHLWRVELNSGRTSLLARDVPLSDGSLALSYSPARRYAAYLRPSGGELVIYDLQTGEQRSVATGPSKLTSFLAGWGPGERPAIALASSEEIVYNCSVWPAGMTELRFYDPTAKLWLRLEPPEAEPSYRIGRWAWSGDGKTLAYLVGPVVEGPSHPVFFPHLMLDARELWLWSEAEGARRLVSGLSGSFVALRWLPGGEVLEMWGYDGWTEDGVRQDALRVHPSGEVVGLNWDALVTAVEGSFRELRAKVVTDRQSSRLVLLDRQGGETVVFQSPRHIGPRVLLQRGAAVLMTYPPVDAARPAAAYVHLVNLGD